MKKKNKRWLAFAGVTSLFWLFPTQAYALDTGEITDTINGLLSNSGSSDTTINTFVMMTMLSIIPVLLVMTTSFTRIIMVLSFVRNSLGTQQNPPNQVLIGLALFLTFFVMQPVYTDIYTDAIKPFQNEEISQQEVFDRSEVRIKEFMYEQTRDKDVELFVDLADKRGAYESFEDLPLTILTPAFIISELRIAFSIGFLIFIPFLIIDMAVASILMSMGMFMLSPVMISLPFKILLFVLVDGWYLVVESLMRSFY